MLKETSHNISEAPLNCTNYTIITISSLFNDEDLRQSQLVHAELHIVLYGLVFLTAVVGNLLVILTLVRHKRMRTVTNVFLLNLAISDLLLAVVCMPVTLVGELLKRYLFGYFMCHLLAFLQGLSVAVSVLTLVSISLERYFAICKPLQSMSWQTLSHAYKCIALVWCISIVLMSPIAAFSRLIKMKCDMGYKCREIYPTNQFNVGYSMILALSLFVLPLLVMIVTYGLVSHNLWRGMQVENKTKRKKFTQQTSTAEGSRFYETGTEAPIELGRLPLNGNANNTNTSKKAVTGDSDVGSVGVESLRRFRGKSPMRQSQSQQVSLTKSRLRVVRMLFVIVLEFFICWTPLYVFNTWHAIDRYSSQEGISRPAMFIARLLSYSNSCSNPITYCFMSRKFRRHFLAAFGCHLHRRKRAQHRQNTATLRSGEGSVRPWFHRFYLRSFSTSSSRSNTSTSTLSNTRQSGRTNSNGLLPVGATVPPPVLLPPGLNQIKETNEGTNGDVVLDELLGDNGVIRGYHHTNNLVELEKGRVDGEDQSSSSSDSYD